MGGGSEIAELFIKNIDTFEDILKTSDSLDNILIVSSKLDHSVAKLTKQTDGTFQYAGKTVKNIDELTSLIKELKIKNLEEILKNGSKNVDNVLKGVSDPVALRRAEELRKASALKSGNSGIMAGTGLVVAGGATYWVITSQAEVNRINNTTYNISKIKDLTKYVWGMSFSSKYTLEITYSTDESKNIGTGVICTIDKSNTTPSIDGTYTIISNKPNVITIESDVFIKNEGTTGNLKFQVSLGQKMINDTADTAETVGKGINTVVGKGLNGLLGEDLNRVLIIGSGCIIGIIVLYFVVRFISSRSENNNLKNKYLKNKFYKK